jgi:hypothetical protein
MLASSTACRRSAIDGHTTRHPGYAISQRICKRVEEAFGWAKTVAGLRKMRHRGLLKVDWQFTLAMAACDLVRLPKLLAGGCSMSRRTYQTVQCCAAGAHSTFRKMPPPPQCRSSRKPERTKINIFSAPCLAGTEGLVSKSGRGCLVFR